MQRQTYAEFLHKPLMDSSYEIRIRLSLLDYLIQKGRERVPRYSSGESEYYDQESKKGDNKKAYTSG